MCVPDLLPLLLPQDPHPEQGQQRRVNDVAMRIANSTATAPTVPIRPRNGIPVMFSASRATMTVVPAKTTALPDVPFASPIDSCTPMPAFSWVRCRLRMKSE